jgi:hypothetical protein
MTVSRADIEEMRLVTTKGVKDAPLPVKYEHAKAALAECQSVDECSTWAKKAAALASYARQADDESLEKMAQRIRARAVRRCGELLKEIPKAAPGRKSGDAPPPISPRVQAARAAGMSIDQTKDAMRVAQVDRKDFEDAIESDDPPTITELAERGTRKVKPLVDIEGRDPAEYNRAIHVREAIADLSVMLGHVKPALVIRGSVPRQFPELKKNAARIVSWLSDLIEEMENT